MIWLRACSKNVSLRLMIFEDGMMDHDQYMKEVFPIALKIGNDIFRIDWTFQQDCAKARIHAK